MLSSSGKRKNIGLIAVAAALGCLLVFIAAGTLAAGQATESSTPVASELSVEQSAPLPAPDPTKDAATLESAPLPVSIEPTEETIVPPKQPAEHESSISLSIPTDSIDFSGEQLAPGETYTQTIDVEVAASGNWTLRLSKDRDMVGVTSGEVLPPGCLSFCVSSDSPSVRYAATEDSELEEETTLARGVTENAEAETTTVTLKLKVTIPWDLEPDNYTMTQSFSAYAI